jgi:hypothetical protein
MQAVRRAIRVSWLMCCGIGSGALAPAAWCPRGWRAVVSVAVLLRPLRRVSFLRGSFRSNEIIVLEEKSAILRLHLCWNAALFCPSVFRDEATPHDLVFFCSVTVCVCGVVDLGWGILSEIVPYVVDWSFLFAVLVACIAGILRSISLCVPLQAPEAGDADGSSVIDRAMGDQHQQPFASVEAQSHLCSKTVQSYLPRGAFCFERHLRCPRALISEDGGSGRSARYCYIQPWRYH